MRNGSFEQGMIDHGQIGIEFWNYQMLGENLNQFQAMCIVDMKGVAVPMHHEFLCVLPVEFVL